MSCPTGRPPLLRTLPPQKLSCRENYTGACRILDLRSDQPHQKAGQRKSAEQHEPIAHVELKKTAVCRNLRIREHDVLCRITNVFACQPMYHGQAMLAVTGKQ